MLICIACHLAAAPKMTQKNRDPYSGTSVSLAFLMPSAVASITTSSFSFMEFIKEIRVRKDYEISITLNASFNQVEQLKAVSTYDGAEIFEEISEKGA